MKNEKRKTKNEKRDDSSSFVSRLSSFDNAIALLPPVSEMMRAAGLEPKKSLGQNFLFDLNLTGRIARSVPNISDTTVVEVGPGPGGLTRALLSAGAKRVIAIEKDKTTEPILRQIQTAAGKTADGDDRLKIIYGDALKFPFAPFGGEGVDASNASGRGSRGLKSLTPTPSALPTPLPQGKGNLDREKFAICSNLPYNIGTELLIRWLHDLKEITSMTLMFQREVAERIVAKPGTPAYGRLSVLVAMVADAKILFNVPRTAFTPMPKVESAVVQIFPKNVGARRDAPRAAREPPLQKIESLTAKLFGQRRKMIRGIIPGVDWKKFGLTGTERAEELSPEKFAELAAAGVV
ncbi:MAG: 16S rRNA (adenine(1518)-N(6)/adenine(1519)-N(6))-dimethyltransferase [Proteobacteria bacterium]|nr:16S rRNA (adenine(1518)-N(6)/adenine(1519)-N(6))-dimethyltransferase [Pseudomonadota bacterium]